MYRSTALYIAKILMRRYQEEQKNVRYMETVFSRMERIWNFKIDMENFKVEDSEEPETPQSSAP